MSGRRTMREDDGGLQHSVSQMLAAVNMGRAWCAKGGRDWVSRAIRPFAW